MPPDLLTFGRSEQSTLHQLRAIVIEHVAAVASRHPNGFGFVCRTQRHTPPLEWFASKDLFVVWSFGHSKDPCLSVQLPLSTFIFTQSAEPQASINPKKNLRIWLMLGHDCNWVPHTVPTTERRICGWLEPSADHSVDDETLAATHRNTQAGSCG